MGGICQADSYLRVLAMTGWLASAMGLVVVLALWLVVRHGDKKHHQQKLDLIQRKLEKRRQAMQAEAAARGGKQE